MLPTDLTELQAYVKRNVLPLYDTFDAAHRRDHALAVISRSLEMARFYPEVDVRLLYVAAACHDIGLQEGREHHHEVSARLIRTDKQLRRFFTDDEIELIAGAAEDHRASSGHAPRSIYGRIVAEADRLIEPELTLRRTVQYGISHYPQLSREEHFRRTCAHLQEKYAEGGYLQLWIPESPNALRLAELRALIANSRLLRETFDRIFEEEIRQA